MKRIVVLLGLALLTSNTALASERVLALQDVKVLTDGRGQTRIAFRIPEIAPGERIAISSAQLTIPLAGVAAERSMRLRVYPITRNWDAGAATWSSPWTRAGGDFDEGLFLAAEADLRNGVAVVDLTGLIREAVEESRPMFGFLLTRDPDDGLGIPTEDAARFLGVANASLRVHYMRVGPRPAER